GLDLVSMQEGKAKKDWKIGTLQGGDSKTHTWFVGGSKSGSYPLQIYLEAIMQPFNKKISKSLVSLHELEVKTGEGLHLYIYPEEDAYIGEAYYVQFQLSNESDMDYHYVTTRFGKYSTTTSKATVIKIWDENGQQKSDPIPIDTGIDYYVPDDMKNTAKITLCKKDKCKFDTLEAGETVCGTMIVQFDADGDPNTEYYHLLNKYVEELDVNNTGIAVTLKPIKSHLTKKTLRVNPTPKPTPTPTPKPTPTPTPPPTPGNTQSVKDPVNLMTGAFTIDHVVAAVSGASALSFDLSYNSLYAETAGEAGRGWYHNYEKHIEQQGSVITFYQNPYEILSFVESEETANIVCGTLEGNTITLADDSSVERIYDQAGTDNGKYRITKNKDGYILSSGQEKYTFDRNGMLTGYVDESGHAVIVTKSEKTLTVTDKATGKSITAAYNEEGRIIGITDAAGQKTTLSYEGDCMTVLTGKTGKKLVYEYDGQGHILKGKEGDKTVYVENTYDEKGRVLTQISNGKKEEITRFAYSENEDGTLSITMTNADKTTEKAVSDEYGQGISYENAIGGVTAYHYNQHHAMTAYKKPDGTGADYSYDSRGNITKIVETTGRTTNYAYDDDNRIIHVVCNDGTDIRYTYNAGGQVESVVGSNGLKASYTYDGNGQILTETSALGTITYTYKDGMLSTLTDYSGNTHSFAYDANGNVVQYIDGSGVVTDYKVDVSGRVTEESVVMKDGKKATVSYTYDDYGKLLSKTDAKGNTTSYTYDEEDRLIEEKRPDGKAFTYTYDSNGNITKITCPDGTTTAEAVYDAAGNALSLTDTLKGIRTASYSAGSQLLSMVQSNGGEIKYTYYGNGLLKSQTDAKGNTTTMVYDAAGRISRVTDGAGAATSFGYDKAGNLTSIENALGNSTELEYNVYRKIIRQKDNSGNVTRYDYDNAMNCI
ncbi:MAG: hypothetical protein K2H34_05545, partial [Lachnospiraceae bacterium]|nr:hypothetical protein [Lachnospiraceae bacterium]